LQELQRKSKKNIKNAKHFLIIKNGVFDMVEKKKMVGKEETISEEGKVVSKKKGKPEEVKKGAVHFTTAVPAKVEEIIGRTGTRGEAIQVRCKVLDGRDQNKVLRRNVRGPVQLGDILMLRETEIEARALSKAGRGSGT
jgi:small subunit ribosomal protein S28e